MRIGVVGAGVFGLAAADKASLFKTFAKVYAQKAGKIATFMAKWSPDYPGQSGHLHLSLQDKSGEPVFHDDRVILLSRASHVVAVAPPLSLPA